MSAFKHINIYAWIVKRSLIGGLKVDKGQQYM